MAKNISDEKQVQKDTRRVKRTAEQRLDAFRAVLGAPSGRLVLRSLIEDCGVFSGGFNPNGSSLYYAEGARNVGLRLLAECERTSPDLFRLMEDEARARVERSERESEPADAPVEPQATNG